MTSSSWSTENGSDSSNDDRSDYDYDPDREETRMPSLNVAGRFDWFIRARSDDLASPEYLRMTWSTGELYADSLQMSGWLSVIADAHPTYLTKL